jgi:hypothetical protein
VEAIKKILRTPSAFVLLLVAIISLFGILIKSKSDENIARIPIDATSTAEVRLTQFANTVIPTQTTIITETITPTQLNISPTQTVEASPAIPLTQSADSQDLNPKLLTFPIISIQDIALARGDLPNGWEVGDSTIIPNIYKTGGSAEQFWSRNSSVVVDPPFDITILNTTNEPIFVTDVGIEIIKVSFVQRAGGGNVPSSERVEIQDEYVLNLPDINAMHISEEDRTLYALYYDLIVNQVVSIKLPDPIYMQPQAPYRFTLTLRDYQIKMPTDVFMRLWVKTNKGEARSRMIFLFATKSAEVPTK